LNLYMAEKVFSLMVSESRTFPLIRFAQDLVAVDLGIPLPDGSSALAFIEPHFGEADILTDKGMIYELAVEAGIRDGLSKHRDVETRREIRVPAWPTLESAAEEFRRIVCEIFGYPC